MKNIIICTFLTASLTGCAAQPATPQQNNSVVELQSSPGFEMLARQQDGQRVSSLKRFDITPGKHTLEVGIVRTGYQDSHRLCIANLTYENFLPGHPYLLSKAISSDGVSIALMSSDHKVVAQAEKIPCL